LTKQAAICDFTVEIWLKFQVVPVPNTASHAATKDDKFITILEYWVQLF